MCIFTEQTLKRNAMVITFWVGFWILVGAILCPIFTIGCIVLSLGYTGFGVVLIVLGVIDFVMDLIKK